MLATLSIVVSLSVLLSTQDLDFIAGLLPPCYWTLDKLILINQRGQLQVASAVGTTMTFLWSARLFLSRTTLGWHRSICSICECKTINCFAAMKFLYTLTMTSKLSNPLLTFLGSDIFGTALTFLYNSKRNNNYISMQNLHHVFSIK